MVYNADTMIPVEMNTPTWRRLAFNEIINSESLDILEDLLDEVRKIAHVREFASKQRIARRFNIKVRPWGFHKGDLVLKKVIDPKKKGKLDPNWEGPSRVFQRLNKWAYKLESLEGVEISRTWNVTSLKFYS